jgi:hypothetical protein
MDLSKLTAAMVIAMIRSGVRHELIYAFLRMEELLVTKRSYRMLPKAEREFWDLAMREYREQFVD